MVKKKQGMIPSSLGKLQITKRNGNQIVIDPDTVEEEGVFKVRPIAFVGNQFFVVCPFCGQIHVHGCVDGHYSGSRTAHCKNMTGAYEIELCVV